jgi:hypothetical protein
MKTLLRSVTPLLMLILASPAFADPAEESRCKKIHGLIVDAQVTEGCTSPSGFCAEGTIEANHGLDGTTYFRMDGAVRGPAAAPGSIATTGILVYTTDRGTLTVRESGLSGVIETPEVGYFPAIQKVLEGTGDYTGATGHLWVLGQRIGSEFVSEVRGELCW